DAPHSLAAISGVPRQLVDGNQRAVARLAERPLERLCRGAVLLDRPPLDRLDRSGIATPADRDPDSGIDRRALGVRLAAAFAAPHRVQPVCPARYAFERRVPGACLGVGSQPSPHDSLALLAPMAALYRHRLGDESAPFGTRHGRASDLGLCLGLALRTG